DHHHSRHLSARDQRGYVRARRLDAVRFRGRRLLLGTFRLADRYPRERRGFVVRRPEGPVRGAGRRETSPVRPASARPRGRAALLATVVALAFSGFAAADETTPFRTRN